MKKEVIMYQKRSRRKAGEEKNEWMEGGEETEMDGKREVRS